MIRPITMRSLLLFTTVLAGSCSEPRFAEREPVEATASRVDLFLRGSGQVLEDVTMVLDGVHLIDASGGIQELVLTRSEVSSQDLEQGQVIAAAVATPGTYDRLVLQVRGAFLETGGRRTRLSLVPEDALADPAPEPGAEEDGGPRLYTVPVQVEVRRHDAVSVFLDWNVGGSIQAGDGFRPRFTPTLERREVRLGLFYVTDPATGSVRAIRRQNGETVATIKVGDRPRGLAITGDRRFLCVANSGDGSLSIVDLLQNFSIFNVPVQFSAETSDVVTADWLRLAAAANTGIDTVSLFDLRRSEKTHDIRVGRAPIRLAVSPRLQRLYVLNQVSEDMSVVDLRTRTVVATVPLESGPSDLAVSRRGRELVVGHTISRNLLVFGAESLQLLETIHIGGGVTAVHADRRRDRYYVARSTPNEVAVVDRGLGSVIRRIPLSARVEALAQPPEGPAVFGAAPGAGGLLEVNVVVGREQSRVPAGSTPWDVVAVD